MITSPTRRDFCKMAGASALALAGTGLVCRTAKAATVTWHWPGGENGFTQAELNLLQRAINFLCAHFDSPAVRANAYQVARRSWVQGEYSQAIGLPVRQDWSWACLDYQLRHYVRGRIPDIYLTAYHEQSNYWANAPVGTVRTVDITRATGTVTGEFRINVNRYWLGRQQGSDPAAWAGVLAHEMLHNLGHVHGRDEYTVDLQINAFQQSVYRAGQYRRGLSIPPFRCGRP